MAIFREKACFHGLTERVHNNHIDTATFGAGPLEFALALALKAVREHMIEGQLLCRKEVNKRIGRNTVRHSGCWRHYFPRNRGTLFAHGEA